MKNKILLLTTMIFLTACSSNTGDRSFIADKPASQKKIDTNQSYEDYVSLAAQYFEKGRYDWVERSLMNAIRINNKRPEAWNILAVLYEETNDLAKANQTYLTLLNKKSDFLLGYKNYATFLCKLGRNSELNNLLNKMRDKNLTFKISSYIYRGDCFISQGKIDQAKQSYLSALKLDSKSRDVLLPLAGIAIKEEDFATALKYLQTIHTYIGYSPESVQLALISAKKIGDKDLIRKLTQIMRTNYSNYSFD